SAAVRHEHFGFGGLVVPAHFPRFLDLDDAAFGLFFLEKPAFGLVDEVGGEVANRVVLLLQCRYLLRWRQRRGLGVDQEAECDDLDERVNAHDDGMLNHGSTWRGRLRLVRGQLWAIRGAKSRYGTLEKTPRGGRAR